jgi:PPOX class probable F420-dependent enzyme
MSPTTPMDVSIPATHLDLVSGAIVAVLTTLDRAGQPQSSLVWVDHDGACVRFNTTLERQKGRNLLADRRASLLIVDPSNTARFIQVRGEVELVVDGAIEHLDGLTRRYTPHPCFYGHVYPAERQAQETRVIGRIHARRITVDAIHA